MSNGKTIGQLMEEARIKAGAKNYAGHDYMDLMRFDEHTRHMIIFDVLSHESPVGFKGENIENNHDGYAGYERAKESEAKGFTKILSHANVRNGHLYYNKNKDQIR